MDKRLLGIAELVAAAAIVLSVFYFSKEIEGLGAYGYVGAFLIALLSSATILIPAPGWAVVIALSRVLNPVAVGIVAGIGSAIGELTAYIAGDGLRDMIDGRLKETKDIENLVRSYDMLAIALLEFIPNPLFDIAGIVAGSLKIPWWRFVIACAAGRVARFVLLAILSNAVGGML